jgi:hypothetical protein
MKKTGGTRTANAGADPRSPKHLLILLREKREQEDIPVTLSA